MTKHIHVHLTSRDSSSWVENYGGKLVVGKTYMINGKKGKVLKSALGGTRQTTPMVLVDWLTTDAFTEYNPREVARLKGEVKELEEKIKETKSPFTKRDLEQVLVKVKAELGKYRDAVNHLGEKTYRTYEAWKAACRAANPSVVFEGNKDICNAKPGVGEWDGEVGVVYKSTRDAILPAKASPELGRLEKEYERALKEYREAVAKGEAIAEAMFKKAGGKPTPEQLSKVRSEQSALKKPAERKLDQAEKVANAAIKAYSAKTGVDVYLVGFNTPGGRYN